MCVYTIKEYTYYYIVMDSAVARVKIIIIFFFPQKSASINFTSCRLKKKKKRKRRRIYGRRVLYICTHIYYIYVCIRLFLLREFSEYVFRSRVHTVSTHLPTELVTRTSEYWWTPCRLTRFELVTKKKKIIQQTHLCLLARIAFLSGYIISKRRALRVLRASAEINNKSIARMSPSSVLATAA